MIEIRNITKAFSGKNILHDLSFKFERGKTNLIIGESGSMKTKKKTIVYFKYYNLLV